MRYSQLALAISYKLIQQVDWPTLELMPVLPPGFPHCTRAQALPRGAGDSAVIQHGKFQGIVARLLPSHQPLPNPLLVMTEPCRSELITRVQLFFIASHWEAPKDGEQSLSCSADVVATPNATTPEQEH